VSPTDITAGGANPECYARTDTGPRWGQNRGEQWGQFRVLQPQRALFEAHARRLAREVAALELRRTYLELKVRYWAAREVGDLDKAAEIAEDLRPVIRQLNPKEYRT
jgi:hypothetical protein